MKTSKSRPRKTSKSRKEFSQEEKKSGKEIRTHEKKPEYVDWLNKKGKIIGILSKEFAHQHGLFHPVAHVFVIDSKNNLIIQKRSMKALLVPGKLYTSAAGHIIAGESTENGAAREAKEELGIAGKLHPLGFIDVHAVTNTYNNNERMHFFWMKTNQKIRIRRSEIGGILRVPVQEATAFFAKNDCTDHVKKSWRKFKKHILRELQT